MIRMRASAPSARAISTSCCSGIDRRRTSVSGSIARADPLEQEPGSRPSFWPADSPPGTARLEPDGDVLGHGQVGKECGLLVNCRDSEGTRTDRIDFGDGRTLDLDRSQVGTMGAGDHLDQGRLARAVLADQRVHFAGLEVERHPLEGLNTGECLADRRQLQQHLLVLGP